MDSWETIKIGAALAGTAGLILALQALTGLVYPDTYVTKAAYKVPGVSEPGVDLAALQRAWPSGLGAEGGPAKLRHYMSNIEKVALPASGHAPSAQSGPPPPQVDLATALAAADVEKGRQTSRVCTSCHTFEPDGQDRTGPGLWGVVGRDVASRPTFAYSAAMTAQAGGWTYERLDHYLANPAKAVPGTKMAFAGLRKVQDRANVIAFLSTLSASPVPFPKAASGEIAPRAERPSGQAARRSSG